MCHHQSGAEYSPMNVTSASQHWFHRSERQHNTEDVQNLANVLLPAAL
jgi:hypothetical protein